MRYRVNAFSCLHGRRGFIESTDGCREFLGEYRLRDARHEGNFEIENRTIPNLKVEIRNLKSHRVFTVAALYEPAVIASTVGAKSDLRF